jgi:hypothetical protein
MLHQKFPVNSEKTTTNPAFLTPVGRGIGERSPLAAWCCSWWAMRCCCSFSPTHPPHVPPTACGPSNLYFSMKTLFHPPHIKGGWNKLDTTSGNISRCHLGEKNKTEREKKGKRRKKMTIVFKVS